MAGRYLIVGLGNPGSQYKDNRHNVGFQIIEYLAARHGLSSWRLQAQAFASTGTIKGQAVVLAKPQSYMNSSGKPVASLHRFYKIELDRLLVIYDDLDLPVGTLRMRPEGGSGGHQGMKSIIEQLGSQSFPRLRVGIGRPPGHMDPADYVLRNFDKEQFARIQEVYVRAADAIETWLQEGVELAMSRHNGPLDPP